MSIDLVAFGWMFLFTTPYEVYFPVRVGVVVFGCTISSKVLGTGTAYFALLKKFPNSDLAADDMTYFIFVRY